MGKNILVFGPNGSGKGTQGAIVQKKYDIPHIESGAIFREHIGGGTELGKKAKEYIDRGDLVPDDITIPMMIARLQKDDCKEGWILDGFPRSKDQAITLVCVNDNNHPNHIAFDAIKPVEKDGKIVCRVCGGDLNTRADDQDEEAINKRHGIYYDENTGTMAAVNYFKGAGGPKVISVDGSVSIGEVTESIMKEL